MQDLIKAGIISEESYVEAKKRQAEKGGVLAEILVDMNAVDVPKFLNFIRHI